MKSGSMAAWRASRELPDNEDAERDVVCVQSDRPQVASGQCGAGGEVPGGRIPRKDVLVGKTHAARMMDQEDEMELEEDSWVNPANG